MLEVPAYRVVDCVNLELIGVKRIYLESGIGESILTPSIGLAKLCKESTDIPIYANIKAHVGFRYDFYELNTMAEDIKELDPYVDGFLIGILDDNNMPDIEAIEEILQGTDKNFIFSRAFDKCYNQMKALEVLKNYNRCQGILTCGGPGKVIDNKSSLRQILDNKGRLEITIASGINLEILSILASNFKGQDFLMGKSLRINNDPNEKLDRDKVKEAKRIIEMHS